MMHPLNLAEYSIEINQNPSGARVIYDPIRQKLIQYTPEEEVRQKVIQFLIKEMGFESTHIEVEVPMSHFEKGAKGRADIIVYSTDREEPGNPEWNIKVPVLIIECKAPFVELNQLTLEQVYAYNEITISWNIAITNGHLIEFHSWDEEAYQYRPLLKIPHSTELNNQVALNEFMGEINTWKYPPFQFPYPQEIIEQYTNGIVIHAQSNNWVQQFGISLITSCFNGEIEFKPMTFGEFEIVEDKGYKYCRFGNASGGSWAGSYKSLLVRRKEENLKLINLSVLAAAAGYTVLIIAIEDELRVHNSLQLNLDRYLKKVDGNKVLITHSGKIAVGNIGAFPNQEVLDFVKPHMPHLKMDGKNIILGELDLSKPFLIENPEVLSFIQNLIAYAILRDDFRNLKVEQRKQ